MNPRAALRFAKRSQRLHVLIVLAVCLFGSGFVEPGLADPPVNQSTRVPHGQRAPATPPDHPYARAILLVGPIDPQLRETLEKWEQMAPDSPAARRLRSRFRAVIDLIEHHKSPKAEDFRGAPATHPPETLSRLADSDASDRLEAVANVAWLEARARLLQGSRGDAIRLVGAVLAFSRWAGDKFGMFAFLSCATTHRNGAELLARWLPGMTEDELALLEKVLRELPPPPDVVRVLHYEARQAQCDIEELEELFLEWLEEARQAGLVQEQSVQLTKKVFAFRETPESRLISAQKQWVKDLEAILRSGRPAEWAELLSRTAMPVIEDWRDELLPFFPELRDRGWLRNHMYVVYPVRSLIYRICRRLNWDPGLAKKKRGRPLALLVARLDPRLDACVATLCISLIFAQAYPIFLRAAVEHLREDQPDSLTELHSLGLTARIVADNNGFTIRTSPGNLELRVMLRKRETAQMSGETQF